jgi:hypothetical protein
MELKIQFLEVLERGIRNGIKNPVPENIPRKWNPVSKRV